MNYIVFLLYKTILLYSYCLSNENNHVQFTFYLLSYPYFALLVGGAAWPLPYPGQPCVLLCLTAPRREGFFAFLSRHFSTLLRPRPTFWDFLLPCCGRITPYPPKRRAIILSSEYYSPIPLLLFFALLF